MFSSLTSFLFGSNTSATPSSQVNQNPNEQEQEHLQRQLRAEACLEVENTIQVTSSTPSVTGTSIGKSRPIHQQGKRGRNRRGGKQNSHNKKNQGDSQRKSTTTPSITNLLTPTDSFDEDIDEDEWFIVEKEEEDKSLPPTDSEEEVSVAEIQRQPYQPAAVQFQVRRQNIPLHSLYSGPRPQQLRNYLQRARNGGSIARGGSLHISTLSPPRNLTARGASFAGDVAARADSGITQPLYAVSLSPNGSDNVIGANLSMEESWYVTPPPCFTSIGPINMETSPFENLLIEHPSMSVYHSIRSAQEATESFVNLDLGVDEAHNQSDNNVLATSNISTDAQSLNNARQRSRRVRMDRYSATQSKQEILARSSQKSCNKKDHQNLCRGAIQRTNKVRDFQSKSKRQRRSDFQHCKLISGANNNRKCAF